MSALLTSHNSPETHRWHGRRVDTPFLPRGLLLDLAHSSSASLFPPGMVLSFSQATVKMRPHVAFYHITSVPWKASIRWYRIKSTEIWFGFPPATVRSSASVSVRLYCPGTKFYFVLGGIGLSLCLFGRHCDFPASDEKEHGEGTSDAHYLTMYVLSNMLQDATS